MSIAVSNAQGVGAVAQPPEAVINAMKLFAVCRKRRGRRGWCERLRASGESVRGRGLVLRGSGVSEASILGVSGDSTLLSRQVNRYAEAMACPFVRCATFCPDRLESPRARKQAVGAARVRACAHVGMLMSVLGRRRALAGARALALCRNVGVREHARTRARERASDAAPVMKCVCQRARASACARGAPRRRAAAAQPPRRRRPRACSLSPSRSQMLSHSLSRSYTLSQTPGRSYTLFPPSLALSDTFTRSFTLSHTSCFIHLHALKRSYTLLHAFSSLVLSARAHASKRRFLLLT
eukprot:107571-Pleurochrysis_carterae.AAC.1